MERTAVKTYIFKNEVTKLCYDIHRAYQIIRSTSHGSYYVREIHKPDSPELKFMAYDLYSTTTSTPNLLKDVNLVAA